MFRNYLKVAIRALWRYKMFSVINVLVFTLGMSLCLLILHMMRDQSSYDTFHANKERIYRVISDVTEEDRARSFATSPAPMAGVLLEEAPAILDVALLRRDFDGLGDLRPENMDIE
jgi:putative ABC transport system permease protein